MTHCSWSKIINRRHYTHCLKNTHLNTHLSKYTACDAARLPVCVCEVVCELFFFFFSLCVYEYLVFGDHTGWRMLLCFPPHKGPSSVPTNFFPCCFITSHWAKKLK